MSTLLYSGLYRLKEPSSAACTSYQILHYVHHKNAHEEISVSSLTQSSSSVVRAADMLSEGPRFESQLGHQSSLFHGSLILVRFLALQAVVLRIGERCQHPVKYAGPMGCWNSSWEKTKCSDIWLICPVGWCPTTSEKLVGKLKSSVKGWVWIALICIQYKFRINMTMNIERL